MTRWRLPRPWVRRPDPLGTGVWRRAFERCRRAVDRYFQMLEAVPAGDVADRLGATGDQLAAVLDAVRERCAQAQSQAPSASYDIPAGPLGRHPDLHRRLSKAATACAQAAEAAAMARVSAAAGDAPTGLARAAAAQRAADLATALLREDADDSAPGGGSAARAPRVPPGVDGQ